jgi:hypothetical protein
VVLDFTFTVVVTTDVQPAESVAVKVYTPVALVVAFEIDGDLVVDTNEFGPDQA